MLCFPVSLMGLLHFRNTFSTHADALNRKFFFIRLCRGPLPIDIVTHTLVPVDSRHTAHFVISSSPSPYQPSQGKVCPWWVRKQTVLHQTWVDSKHPAIAMQDDILEPLRWGGSTHGWQ
ncbi:hypothetical protein NXS19_012403 [Fusarium pseudograminearum]|nr:hypothetical protein NXS19_012403 [Fusarium pseudograminearum]